jgi:group I intron endonuclease
MIINDSNGKYYVGKHKGSDLQKYFRRCLREAQAGLTKSRSKPHLYAAIRKHGPEVFRIHPLMSTIKTDAELYHWEEFLIGLFKAREVGYNIAAGGDCPGIVPWTPERRAAQAERMKLQGLAGWNKGTLMPSVSEKMKGNTRTLGKHTHTLEGNKRISEARSQQSEAERKASSERMKRINPSKIRWDRIKGIA